MSGHFGTKLLTAYGPNLLFSFNGLGQATLEINAASIFKWASKKSQRATVSSMDKTVAFHPGNVDRPEDDIQISIQLWFCKCQHSQRPENHTLDQNRYWKMTTRRNPVSNSNNNRVISTLFSA